MTINEKGVTPGDLLSPSLALSLSPALADASVRAYLSCVWYL